MFPSLVTLILNAFIWHHYHTTKKQNTFLKLTMKACTITFLMTNTIARFISCAMRAPIETATRSCSVSDLFQIISPIHRITPTMKAFFSKGTMEPIFSKGTGIQKGFHQKCFPLNFMFFFRKIFLLNVFDFKQKVFLLVIPVRTMVILISTRTSQDFNISGIKWSTRIRVDNDRSCKARMRFIICIRWIR